MCGDLRCRSCGPAQGNDYCPYCGAWADDGGCKNPAECEAKANEDAAGQEREYLVEKILEDMVKDREYPYWESDEYKEVNALPIEELRARSEALKKTSPGR